MKSVDYPVKMRCAITGENETVFFHPKEQDGKWIVHMDSFNGCNHNWSRCQECEDCKLAAFRELTNKPG